MPVGSRNCGARVCAVIGCSNGDYRLNKWKSEDCLIHGVKNGQANCVCDPPFTLFTYPTKLKNPSGHEAWKQCVNRADPKEPWKLLSPTKAHRICSRHFVDGKPTEVHPNPELNMGYTLTEDPATKLRQVFQALSRTEDEKTILTDPEVPNSTHEDIGQGHSLDATVFKDNVMVVVDGLDERVEDAGVAYNSIGQQEMLPVIVQSAVDSSDDENRTSNSGLDHDIGDESGWINYDALLNEINKQHLDEQINFGYHNSNNNGNINVKIGMSKFGDLIRQTDLPPDLIPQMKDSTGQKRPYKKIPKKTMMKCEATTEIDPDNSRIDDPQIAACSKVPNDCSDFRKKLHQFYLNSFLCDTLIQTKDSVVKAHSCVLAARSSFLITTVFSSDREWGSIYQLDLSNFETIVVKMALDYIYTGEVTDVGATEEHIVESRFFQFLVLVKTLEIPLDDFQKFLNKPDGCTDKKLEMTSGQVRRRNGRHTNDDIGFAKCDGSNGPQDVGTKAHPDSGLEARQDVGPNAPYQFWMVSPPIVQLSQTSGDAIFSSPTSQASIPTCLPALDALLDRTRSSSILSKDLPGSKNVGQVLKLSKPQPGNSLQKSDKAPDHSELLQMISIKCKKRKLAKCDGSNGPQDVGTKAHPDSGLEARQDVGPNAPYQFWMVLPPIVQPSQTSGDAIFSSPTSQASIPTCLPALDALLDRTRSSSILSKDLPGSKNVGQVLKLSKPQPGNSLQKSDKAPDHSELLQMISIKCKKRKLAPPTPCEKREQAPPTPENATTKLICEKCGMGFDDETDLRMHERHVHLGNSEVYDKHKCTVCEKGFKHEGYLNSHMRIKHGDHIKVLRPNKFLCDCCGKLFRTRRKIQEHLNRVNNLNPCTYKCVVCGKGFNDRVRMHEHTRVHTNEKNFVCPTCCKCFRSKSELSSHVEIHKAVRRHRCKLCDKQFAVRCNLRRHMKKHHSVSDVKMDLVPEAEDLFWQQDQ